MEPFQTGGSRQGTIRYVEVLNRSRSK